MVIYIFSAIEIKCPRRIWYVKQRGLQWQRHCMSYPILQTFVLIDVLICPRQRKLVD